MFVNRRFLYNVDHVPNLDVPNVNMNMLFGNITPTLQRFYEVAYTDDLMKDDLRTWS